MSVSDYQGLAVHAGCEIECVTYAGQNAALECVTHGVVLIDFDYDGGGDGAKEHNMTTYNDRYEWMEAHGVLTQPEDPTPYGLDEPGVIPSDPGGPNRCPVCDAPQIGVHYHERDDEEDSMEREPGHTDDRMGMACDEECASMSRSEHQEFIDRFNGSGENPDEVTPCLVCGEPKPNSKPCLNTDCSMFGGGSKLVTLTFQVYATSDKNLPNDDSFREALENALPDEWRFLYAGDEWMVGQVNVEPMGVGRSVSA